MAIGDKSSVAINAQTQLFAKINPVFKSLLEKSKRTPLEKLGLKVEFYDIFEKTNHTEELIELLEEYTGENPDFKIILNFI